MFPVIRETYICRKMMYVFKAFSPILSCYTNSFWIAITVPTLILKPDTAVFRERKNIAFSILHLFQVWHVQTNVKNLISFCFSFFFKRQISLYTEFSWKHFSNEDLKTLHLRLIWDNCYYYPLWAAPELRKQLAIRNHLTLYKVITSFHGCY